MFEQIVVITRKTRLDELVERFNTVGQARFYIEHAGANFEDYEQEDAAYHRAIEITRRSLPSDMKVQFMDRSLVPTVLFTQQDLIITLGQDGLVANVAKYVKGQPIIAVNPDVDRFDGIILPFLPGQIREAVATVINGKARTCEVTMAEARLQDGQRLLAFNDVFIGASSHVSARYTLTLRDQTEHQSSSGVLVSTGAGSTGWISSAFNMAGGIASAMGCVAPQCVTLPWQDPRLFFVTREPFISRHSTANIVAGWIADGQELRLESNMPTGGCIFSDGIQSDSVEFNAGAVATIRRATEKAVLVTS